MSKMYRVSEEELRQLLDAYIFLEALEAYGVDNWDGYAIAKGLVGEDAGEEALQGYEVLE